MILNKESDIVNNLASILNKERKNLEEFYNNLYAEDKKLVEKDALEYSAGDINKAKDFIAGYYYSIKQPHTRSIRLIELYIQDYIIPRYKKNPSDTYIVSCIRDIFRNKLYPRELFLEDEKNINNI